MVQVGMTCTDDADATAKTLGFNAALGNQCQQAGIMADYLNKQGGIGRTKIVLQNHHTRTTDALADPQTYGQSNCTYLTQDHPVAFVIEYNYSPSTPYVACLLQRGVRVINRSIQSPFGTLFAKYPTQLYDPSGLEAVRAARSLVAPLIDNGFLTKSSTIGLFRPDGPDFEQSGKAIRAALKARGLVLRDEGTFPINSDLNQQQAAGKSAAFKFFSEGIDHVLFTGVGSSTYFMLGAESQRYYPKYGMGSDVDPSGTAALIPHDQFPGSVVVGWQPSYDAGTNHQDGPVSATETLCRKVMTAGGVDMTSETTAVTALNICDSFMFLQTYGSRAASLSAKDFAAAVAAAPLGFSSAVAIKADLTGRHDGGQRYRTLAWNTGCECFRFTSKAQKQLPR